jgi:hypothetical protein
VRERGRSFIGRVRTVFIRGRSLLERERTVGEKEEEVLWEELELCELKREKRRNV